MILEGIINLTMNLKFNRRLFLMNKELNEVIQSKAYVIQSPHKTYYISPGQWHSDIEQARKFTAYSDAAERLAAGESILPYTKTVTGSGSRGGNVMMARTANLIDGIPTIPYESIDH